MNNDINLVKDIYEFSIGIQPLLEEKINIKITNNSELLFESIRLLLCKGNEYQKKKIIGINAYIDYKIFSKQFSYYDIDKNLKVFNEAIPRLKNIKNRDKKYLLEEMAIDYYDNLEILFVAARIRRKYFNGNEVNRMMNFYRNEFN